MQNNDAKIVPVRFRGLQYECTFQTSRSSGPGGQHVNKTESRVELRFDIENSKLLSSQEKERIKTKMFHKISNEGILQIAVQDTRSQIRNKEIAIERFIKEIELALKIVKTRKPTKPSKIHKEKRLEAKRRRAEIKKLRNKDF